MPYLVGMPGVPIHAAATSRNPGPVAMNRDEAGDSVPVSDARHLGNTHGRAELSLFEGASHRLHHDPMRWPCRRAGPTACVPRRFTPHRSGCDRTE